jgi:hypothetical protein
MKKNTCYFILSLAFVFFDFAQIQYASSVLAFSSQWGTSSWSAGQATGAPNTNSCGDITTAWASATSDGQREFLVLGYSTPQNVASIIIRETYNPGAVDTIYLRNASNGSWNMVFSQTAMSVTICPRDFIVNITPTSYLVNAVRLAINSPSVSGWNEIDAVGISSIQNPPTSVKNYESEPKHDFIIYPSTLFHGDMCKIKSESAQTLYIYDIHGKEALKLQVEEGSSSVTLPLSSGVYLVKNMDGSFCKKIVIQ